MLSCRRIIWVGGAEKSYAADFQHINMHAISTDQSAFQRPCIYMQMEPSTSEFDEDAVADDDVDDEQTPEVRLVPSDASICASNQPFISLKYCSQQHHVSLILPLTYC